MINQKKFVKLGIKQKIYKIASTMRGVEEDYKNKRPADLEPLWNYIRFVEPDREHKKMKRALDIINDAMKDWNTIDNNSERVKTLNFCYHNLLALINESVGEKFFSVKQMDSDFPKMRFSVAAILDNIRSPFNVGNMFRSADCLGVGRLSLCGITPHPPSIKIERTAMGTLNAVQWDYFETTTQAIAAYRKQNYRVIALETGAQAISPADIKNFDKTVFVFGNEEFGITDNILSECDAVLELPMVGIKNSMNVANTFAIVFAQSLEYFLKQSQ